MNLIGLPNPAEVSQLLGSVKNMTIQETQVVNSVVSAAYSAVITAMWQSGSGRLIDWLGEGQALKDAATAIYLALQPLQQAGYLVLTVPVELLKQDMSRFQTQYIASK